MKTSVPEPARELSDLESEESSRGNVQGRRTDASVLDPTRPAQLGFADAGGTLDDVLRSRVYETLPDAILVTLDGQVAYANSAAKRLFGDEIGNAFAGCATMELLHPASRSVVENRIEETLRTGFFAPDALPAPFVPIHGIRIEDALLGDAAARVR